MTAIVEQGLVSTIIPVFNRPELIVDAVNSVLEQTYRPIEIIVVDDGSTDDTPSVLKHMDSQIDELKVLTQENAGPGVARELARQNAKGEFIQYLDSDDLLFKEKFELQVSALRQSPESVVAYGKTASGYVNEAPNMVAIRLTGELQLSMFPMLLRTRWWGTSTPLYRRSELDKAGAWLDIVNEEDWEYDCRIASLGGRLIFVDEFVSHARLHNQHLSFEGTTDPQKLKHRCIAQGQIYQHALSYMQLDSRVSDIKGDDWSFYSKAVFLLARQCAEAGLVDETKKMISLSIQASGSLAIQQRVFRFFARLFGWQTAVKLAKAFGK